MSDMITRSSALDSISKLIDEYNLLVDIANARTRRIAELEAERRWIPVSESLPKIIITDGEVNSVFVKYADWCPDDCGSKYSISNTEYLSLHPHLYALWMPIPPEQPND